MRLHFSTLLLATVFFAHQARATVNLDIQTGALRTSGGAVVTINTTAVLVSDTDGFSDLTTLSAELLGLNLTVGSTFGSGSKILSIIGTTDIDGSNRFGYVDNATYNLTTLGLTGAAGTAGTDLAILWFPGLTGTGARTLTNSQSFGFYRSDSIDTLSGGTFTFNMPADTAAESIYALDTNIGGGLPPSTFNAAGTVGAVPEPSRSMLALIGLTCLLGRRKRI